MTSGTAVAFEMTAETVVMIQADNAEELGVTATEMVICSGLKAPMGSKHQTRTAQVRNMCTVKHIYSQNKQNNMQLCV